MILKDWFSIEGFIERIMFQFSSFFFIIDSFDELNFVFEEFEFALCEDWIQVYLVFFFMSSLLRKVMFFELFLLVITRFIVCKKLEFLLKSQRFVELLGMFEDVREEYIYQFFEDKKWVL